MDNIFVIFVGAMTSVLAHRLVKGTFTANVFSIQLAVRALFEWIGLFVCFLVFNLAVGAAIILAIRGFTPYFVALYGLESVFLLIVSAAQGFVFQFLWNRYK